MKKRFLIAAALILTLTSGIAVGAAAGGYVDITASIAYPISIKYNGELQVMKDASGNQVYPITYQGTTYVPIRAVSNMLGIAVDWDQETQSVLLGETPPAPSPSDTPTPSETIKYYDEYPSVPDFGAFSNFALTDIDFDNESAATIYFYSTETLYKDEKNLDLITNYLDLLREQGFICFSTNDDNDVLTMAFVKGNMYVNFGISPYDILIFVSEL